MLGYGKRPEKKSSPGWCLPIVARTERGIPALMYRPIGPTRLPAFMTQGNE
jgi:hypothetical protein